MKYGYARVSTVGQSLREQVDNLLKHGVRRKNLYHEKKSGSNTKKRPQFHKLMRVLKPGDTLYFTRLDRFARNTSDALKWIKYLQNKGVNLNVTQQLGPVSSNGTGQLVVTILSAIADFERQLILARTDEGRRIAMAKGQHFGQHFRMQKSDKAKQHYLAVYRTYQKRGATKAAAIFGMSRTNVYKIKRSVENYLAQHPTR